MEHNVLSILYGGFTSAGMKDRNEDAFAAILPASHVRYSKGAVAGIADGVSCSNNAHVASQTSVTTFIQDYLSTPETWDVKNSASRVLSALNAWLYSQGQGALTRHNGFVTTFSAVILKSTTAHVLHCGDSRVYRWRDRQLQQLTSDHNFVRGSAVMLTRALGMDNELKVDYQQRSLRVGDVLMFTTDGVHGILKHTDFAALLQQAADACNVEGEGCSKALEKVAQDIAGQALQAGSTDNISCLLLKVINLPVENLDEVHRNLTRLAIPPVLAPGNNLDGYTISKVLHAGPRSHLYLATHPRYRQKFVIKAPSQRFDEDPHYLEGFLREQWVGRKVDHAGIMKIFEPVHDSRFLYHICEHIDGITLRQWMLDNPRPPLTIVCERARQIAQALRVFQRLGMLHRDLKPDNIMLDAAGDIKLIDFGTVQVNGLQDISTPLDESMPMGTTDYMAPEYLLGEKGEHRSDIFSFGVIVYEMLTGALPFSLSSGNASRRKDYDAWQYRNCRHLRPDLPEWLEPVLSKACAPRPSLRYAALSEFIHDLEVPNLQMLQMQQQTPLIEKNPVRFWQVIAGVLLVLLILQAMLGQL